MAEAARANNISREEIEAYLDRWEGLEEEALGIMMTAMAECKNGPRSGQKDLRAEMKGKGVRMKTFNALWAQRDFERKARAKLDALEDDDRDQMREFVQAMGDTPFGQLIQARLDEPLLP
jgi:uncharacterized protein (UPF0335 family)